MKFCSKCGRHYKDSDKFCKNCGIELTQGASDDDKLNEIKENASQMFSQAGSKAASTVKDFQNMDAEQRKATLHKKLPQLFNKKLIAVVVVLLLIFAGYQYFSPEKQVERAASNVIEVMSDINEKHVSQMTNAEINDYAALMLPKNQENTKKVLQKRRDYAIQNSKYDDTMTSMGTNYENMKVKSAVVKGDKATVLIARKDTGEIFMQRFMKKIDGKWYDVQISGYDLENEDDN